MDIVLGYTEKLVLKNYQSFGARSGLSLSPCLCLCLSVCLSLSCQLASLFDKFVGCFTDPYRRDACLLLSILVSCGRDASLLSFYHQIQFLD